MQAIKNIIFDLGGVFIDIHYQKTEDAFIDLGVTDFHTLFTQHHASDIFELLETGKLSPAAFYDAFRATTQLSLSNEQIKIAWNAMLGNFGIEKIEWLNSIRSKYNIFLFSNTNQIHYDGFMEIYREQTGRDDFNDHFIKAYYSQHIGVRKPYPESFQYILKEQGLNVSETLFIDDTLKNIEGAKAVGLQTIHLNAPVSVIELGL